MLSFLILENLTVTFFQLFLKSCPSEKQTFLSLPSSFSLTFVLTRERKREREFKNEGVQKNGRKRERERRKRREREKKRGSELFSNPDFKSRLVGANGNFITLIQQSHSLSPSLLLSLSLSLSLFSPSLFQANQEMENNFPLLPLIRSSYICTLLEIGHNRFSSVSFDTLITNKQCHQYQYVFQLFLCANQSFAN